MGRQALVKGSSVSCSSEKKRKHTNTPSTEKNERQACKRSSPLLVLLLLLPLRQKNARRVTRNVRHRTVQTNRHIKIVNNIPRDQPAFPRHTPQIKKRWVPPPKIYISTPPRLTHIPFKNCNLSAPHRRRRRRRKHVVIFDQAMTEHPCPSRFDSCSTRPACSYYYCHRGPSRYHQWFC